MMTEGTFEVVFSDDGSGGIEATVNFMPTGSTESYPIGNPVAVSAGQVLCIGPSCVLCDLQTTVDLGDPVASVRAASRKAAGPSTPTRPDDSTPTRPPAPAPTPRPGGRK
jgi:hypothetical protein